MNASWIEEIYNNTDAAFAMWSTDYEHNGAFEDFDSRARLGDNDWDHVFVIQPRARIKAHWCGIPWYHDGATYRVIAAGNQKVKFGLRLNQAELDEGDGIDFIDFGSGARFARIRFPQAADRQYAMIISGDASNPHFELQPMQAKHDKQMVVDWLLGEMKEAYELLKVAAGQALLGKLKSE